MNNNWKRKAAMIAVAAWNWNPEQPSPSSPYLSNFYFDPFQMLEKEVPWWDKT